jgi:hypothetical protein
LDYFFEALESIGRSTRDGAFSFAFHSVINPRFREPETGNETLAELMVDKVDYAVFRDRCFDLAESGLGEDILVQAVVGSTLAWAWRFADPSQLPETVARHRDAIAYFEAQCQDETDEQRRATLRGMVSWTQTMMQSAAERQQQAAARYKVLCEELLPKLEIEESLRWASSRTRRDA